jgi:acetylornithine deacetylase/succinyl-diaminopimelate desuccinylase-like protein
MNPHLPYFFDFLRFDSVSTDPKRKHRVAECAAWLQALLTERGFTAEVAPTEGHPVVLARNQHKPGRPTVLIYGHYDVQPEDPVELWHTRPFEPEIRNGRIYARGATDNKGQMFAHLSGASETMAESGDLPVNLIFLFEGEEEIGSLNLASFLEKRKAELACDIVAVSDTGMVAPGWGTLTYGLRGIACMELFAQGPVMDLHSGIFGGSVLNPVTELARLVASLHDENRRVAVPGFYDGVQEPAPWELESWSRLPGEELTLQLAGTAALGGEAGYNDAARRWMRPTAEVNGMGGGYQGAGSKTIIPSKAFAKLSFRLVPGQDPSDILEKVTAYLKPRVPLGVTVEFDAGHTGQPYLMNPHSPMGEAARRALIKTFPNKEPALIREGGSIPIVNDFKRILGADTLLLGLALPDAQIHAPNENFPVENFVSGIRLNRVLLEELSRV